MRYLLLLLATAGAMLGVDFQGGSWLGLDKAYTVQILAPNRAVINGRTVHLTNAAALPNGKICISNPPGSRTWNILAIGNANVYYGPHALAMSGRCTGWVYWLNIEAGQFKLGKTQYVR